MTCFDACCSLEPRRAAAHNFALANELGIEFAAVESEEDVEIDTCARAVNIRSAGAE